MSDDKIMSGILGTSDDKTSSGTNKSDAKISSGNDKSDDKTSSGEIIVPSSETSAEGEEIPGRRNEDSSTTRSEAQGSKNVSNIRSDTSERAIFDIVKAMRKGQITVRRRADGSMVYTNLDNTHEESLSESIVRSCPELFDESIRLLDEVQEGGDEQGQEERISQVSPSRTAKGGEDDNVGVLRTLEEQNQSLHRLQHQLQTFHNQLERPEVDEDFVVSAFEPNWFGFTEELAPFYVNEDTREAVNELYEVIQELNQFKIIIERAYDDGMDNENEAIGLTLANEIRGLPQRVMDLREQINDVAIKHERTVGQEDADWYVHFCNIAEGEIAKLYVMAKIVKGKVWASYKLDEEDRELEERIFMEARRSQLPRRSTITFGPDQIRIASPTPSVVGLFSDSEAPTPRPRTSVRTEAKIDRKVEKKKPVNIQELQSLQHNKLVAKTDQVIKRHRSTSADNRRTSETPSRESVGAVPRKLINETNPWTTNEEASLWWDDQGNSYGGGALPVYQQTRPGAFAGGDAKAAQQLRPGVSRGGETKSVQPPKPGVSRGGETKSARPPRSGVSSGGEMGAARAPGSGVFAGGDTRAHPTFNYQAVESEMRGIASSTPGGAQAKMVDPRLSTINEPVAAQISMFQFPANDNNFDARREQVQSNRMNYTFAQSLQVPSPHRGHEAHANDTGSAPRGTTSISEDAGGGRGRGRSNGRGAGGGDPYDSSPSSSRSSSSDSGRRYYGDRTCRRRRRSPARGGGGGGGGGGRGPNDPDMPDSDWYRSLPPPWNIVPMKRKDRTLDRGLDKVTIQKFRGEPNTYFAWRSAVLSTIHTIHTKVSTKISAIQRNMDEKDDRVRSLVPAMVWNANCYYRLICNLEVKFGGVERLIAHHLAEVRGVPKVGRRNSSDLHTLIFTLTTYFDILTECGRLHNVHGLEFYCMVLNKLPPDYQEAFQLYHMREFGDEPEDVRTLYQWMGIRLKMLHKSEISTTSYRAMYPDSKLGTGGGNKKNFGEWMGSDEEDLEPMVLYDVEGNEVCCLQTLGAGPTKKFEGGTSGGTRLFVKPPGSASGGEGRGDRRSKDQRFEQSKKYPQQGAKERRPANYQKGGKDIRMCSDCVTPHLMQECPKFLAKSPLQRSQQCKDEGRCFRCLYLGHNIRKCQSRSLKCGFCSRYHHTLIHGWKGREPERRFTEPQEGPDDSEIEWPQSDEEDGDYSVHVAKANEDTISLRVVPIWLIDKDGRRRQYNALLDEGAQGSYLSEKARQELGLQGRKLQRKITGVGNKTGLYNAIVTTVQAKSMTCDHEFDVPVFCIPDPVGNLQAVDWSQAKLAWRYLKGLEFMSCEGGVDLLIGANIPGVHVTLQEASGGDYSPIARRGVLGWTAAGPIKPSENAGESSKVFTIMGDEHCFMEQGCQTREDHEVEVGQTLRRRDPYGIESFGVKSEGMQEPGAGETVDRELSELVHHQTRVQGSLIGEEQTRNIAGEEALCKQDEYVKAMKMRLEKHYLRRVEPGGENMDLAYYLPHFRVKKRDHSTTEVRIVDDGTIRKPHVTFIADVKRMYLRIFLPPEDREFRRLRFPVEEEVGEYKYLVLLNGEELGHVN